MQSLTTSKRWRCRARGKMRLWGPRNEHEVFSRNHRVFSPSLHRPVPRKALCHPNFPSDLPAEGALLPAGAGQRLPPPELLISALSPIINISVQGLARRCPDLPLLRYRPQIKPSQAERGTKHSIFYRALLSPETRSDPAFLSPGCEPSFLLIIRNCCCLIKWRE